MLQVLSGGPGKNLFSAFWSVFGKLQGKVALIYCWKSTIVERGVNGLLNFRSISGQILK